MAQAEKLWLGGRAFTYAQVMTVRQDLFVMMHARHAGLVGASIQEGEDPADFMRRLMDNLLSSGRALLLMGGLLVPEGKGAWSPEVAEETAEVLGAIVDRGEKERLYNEMASALLAFFVKGLGSWIASASSSEEASKPVPETGPGESGPLSSESSPDTTPTAGTSSPDGA